MIWHDYCLRSIPMAFLFVPAALRYFALMSPSHRMPSMIIHVITVSHEQQIHANSPSISLLKPGTCTAQPKDWDVALLNGCSSRFSQGSKHILANWNVDVVGNEAIPGKILNQHAKAMLTYAYHILPRLLHSPCSIKTWEFMNMCCKMQNMSNKFRIPCDICARDTSGPQWRTCNRGPKPLSCQ